MYLAERLRQFREVKSLSQGDMEQRTGLRRCYISRVENGHTVPSVETLEKMARGLEIPLYQLFYDGNEKPPKEGVPEAEEDWASHGKGQRLFMKICRVVGGLGDGDRALVLHLAEEVSAKKRRGGGLDRK